MTRGICSALTVGRSQWGTFMKVLFSPFGRSGRISFWLMTFIIGPLLYQLPIIVLVLADARDVDVLRKVQDAMRLVILTLLASPKVPSISGAAILACILFAYYAVIACWIRRLHDLGNSGWWLLFYLSPFVMIYPLGKLQALGWSEALPSFLLGDTGLHVLLAIGVLFQFVMVAYLGFRKGDEGANRFGPAR